MSKARKTRKLIRWARYFNRYSGTVDYVRIGGNAAADAICSGVRTWHYVRRQAKR